MHPNSRVTKRRVSHFDTHLHEGCPGSPRPFQHLPETAHELPGAPEEFFRSGDFYAFLLELSLSSNMEFSRKSNVIFFIWSRLNAIYFAAAEAVGRSKFQALGSSKEALGNPW